MAVVTNEYLASLVSDQSLWGIENLYLPSQFGLPDVQKKLMNAAQSYGFPLGVRSEDVFVLYDDTVFGSAKDGFIIGRHGLYYKETFQKPVFVPFNNMKITFLKGKFNFGLASYAPTQMKAEAKYAVCEFLQKLAAFTQDAVLPNSDADAANDEQTVLIKNLLQYVADKHGGDGEYWHVGSNITNKQAVGAISKYAHGIKVEDILFLSDDSLMGKGGTGLIITANRIMAHVTFGNDINITISDLKSAYASGDKVYVNGTELKFDMKGMGEVAYFLKALLALNAVRQDEELNSKLESGYKTGDFTAIEIYQERERERQEQERQQRIKAAKRNEFKSDVPKWVYQYDAVAELVADLSEQDIKCSTYLSYFRGFPLVAEHYFDTFGMLFEAMQAPKAKEAYHQAVRTFACNILSYALLYPRSETAHKLYLAKIADDDDKSDVFYQTLDENTALLYHERAIFSRLSTMLMLFGSLIQNKINDPQKKRVYESWLVGCFCHIFLLPLVSRWVNAAQRSNEKSSGDTLDMFNTDEDDLSESAIEDKIVKAYVSALEICNNSTKGIDFDEDPNAIFHFANYFNGKALLSNVNVSIPILYESSRNEGGSFEFDVAYNTYIHNNEDVYLASEACLIYEFFNEEFLEGELTRLMKHALI